MSQVVDGEILYDQYDWLWSIKKHVKKVECIQNEKDTWVEDRQNEKTRHNCNLQKLDIASVKTIRRRILWHGIDVCYDVMSTTVGKERTQSRERLRQRGQTSNDWANKKSTMQWYLGQKATHCRPKWFMQPIRKIWDLGNKAALL